MTLALEAIKDEIQQLSAEGKAALAAWIIEQDSATWDEQMETDFSPGGAGMALLDGVDADFRAGRVMPLDEVLAGLRLDVEDEDTGPNV